MLLVVVCGSVLAYNLLCVRRHTVCSLCKRACGGGHVFGASHLGYLCWCGYRCAFLVFVALRSAARHILAPVLRWPVRLLLLVHVWFVFFLSLCLRVFLFLLVVCGSLRAFFISFFHPFPPFIPFFFSAAVVALLRLWRHVCTGIPFAPYVCGVWGWAWSVGYVSWYSSVR